METKPDMADCRHGWRSSSALFHALLDPRGDSNRNEVRGDDYPAKYAAQVLVAVDARHAGETPAYYPYVAVQIMPDQLTLVEYDGTTVTELDTAGVGTGQNVWYTVRAQFDGNTVKVYRTSTTAGEAMVTLEGGSTVLQSLDGATSKTGSR